jgi:hypothetical protein
MKGRRKRVRRKDGSSYRSKGERKRWATNRKERGRSYATGMDRTQQEVWLKTQREAAKDRSTTAEGEEQPRS